jgi:site-specific recombinase XerD
LNWRNPARKVKVCLPKIEALDPISLDDFNKLLAVCERKTLAGERDRALLMLLLDTGARKAEVTALTLDDIDLATGSVQIRKGKGGKARTVFIGATARRAMLAYLRQREAFLAYLARTNKTKPTEALWVGSLDGKKLNQDGIRQILRRRAGDAGIPEPSPHSFRRAFALNSLRNGMNILALQRLLGHADLSVINRYVKLLDGDLRSAHEEHGVVDSL